MRVERTMGISRALPLPGFYPVEEQARRSSNPKDTPVERVLEEIAAEFNMRDMDGEQALQLANRLRQEELISPAEFLCLTGVPMRLVIGVGCQPVRTGRMSGHRYDYIGEFAGYVDFAQEQDNMLDVELLQSVLNTLYSLDTTRRNGSLNILA